MLRFQMLPMLALACSAAVLAGCTGEPAAAPGAEEPDLPVAPQATGDRPPPSGANGLLPSCFWATGAQQALRSLGAAALDQGGGSLPAISLELVPAECRSVLEDAVQCALPQGQTLVDPVTSIPYTGWWGLAASWKTGALDTSGRRYVTACLLQRLNAFGASVPILLEGPAPAIQENATLQPLYPVEESTAFGDLFSSQTPLLGILPPFKAYVCWEGLLPQGCGPLGLPLFQKRICDDLPLCGLVTLGACDLVCQPNGPYHKCSPLLPLLSPPWTQTVRVRLESESCQ